MQNRFLHRDLENYIRAFIPSGWVGPISEFTSVPSVQEEDYKFLLDGGKPEELEGFQNTFPFKECYYQEAIKEYFNMLDNAKDE